MTAEPGRYRFGDSDFVVDIPAGTPALTLHIVLLEGFDPSDPDIGDGVAWVFVDEAERASIAFWVLSGKEAGRYLGPEADPGLNNLFDQMAESIRKL